MVLDEWLHPFARMFESLADLDGVLQSDDAALSMRIVEAKLDTPIELEIGVADDGTVVIASAPPTQHVETTWMPVFHQIGLSIRAEEPESERTEGARGAG